MSDEKKSTMQVQVFSEEFFELWGSRSDSIGCREAETSVAAKIEPVRGKCADWDRHRVLGAVGESFDVALATFRNREHGLLFLTAYRAEGKDTNFGIGPEEDEEGWYPFMVAVDSAFQRQGGLRYHDAEVVPIMAALDAVVKSPELMSFLLEAAGPTCVALAGHLFARRLREGDRVEVEARVQRDTELV